MKKILQLKADRVGDGAGRGRKILQQRSTGWKVQRHRVRRALQQQTIPCWEMEAGDAHRDVVGSKGKAMGEERSSF